MESRIARDDCKRRVRHLIMDLMIAETLTPEHGLFRNCLGAEHQLSGSPTGLCLQQLDYRTIESPEACMAGYGERIMAEGWDHDVFFRVKTYVRATHCHRHCDGILKRLEELEREYNDTLVQAEDSSGPRPLSSGMPRIGQSLDDNGPSVFSSSSTPLPDDGRFVASFDTTNDAATIVSHS